MEPVSFTRGPADVAKMILVYGVAVPMAVFGVAFASSLLLALLASLLGLSGGVVLGAWVVGFFAPVVFAVRWGIGKYRYWKIDRVTVGSDRIEWDRKGRKEEILFDDLSMVRFEGWITRIRSRNGAELTLRGPTWPMRDLQAPLLERAIPRMIRRLVSCLEGGDVVCFNAPGLKAISMLLLGCALLVASPAMGIFALNVLKMELVHGAYAVAYAVGMFLLGIGGIWRFLQLYGHRIEMDRNGIRVFSLPNWRRISWNQLRVVSEDNTGIRISGDEARPQARIDIHLDNYEVMRRLIRRQSPVSASAT